MYSNDKNNLAKLRWATGNLKSTGSANYVWTTATDYGYYYTFYSTYTGNTDTNNTDPCSKLNTAYYGTGWRTPSRSTLIMLSRCTNKALVNKGMWFMNSSTGLFYLLRDTVMIIEEVVALKPQRALVLRDFTKVETMQGEQFRILCFSAMGRSILELSKRKMVKQYVV